ncbi:MAG: ABC transporter permease [Gammaproteobacteria bacterium]|nr:MAG: ABC transporter permease [Gammaproteobacteria bacterium]
MILALARLELMRLLRAPLAWGLLAVLQFLLALLFLMYLDNFLVTLQPKLAALPSPPGVTETVLVPTLTWATLLWLAVTPLLSMRSIAEERQQGRLDLYFSAPISVTELVLGKFLGLVAFVLFGVLLLTAMLASLSLGTPLDWGRLAGGLIGLLLSVSAFLAAGVYLSARIAQPGLAALLGYALLALLFALWLSGRSETNPSSLFVWLSGIGHFLGLAQGLLRLSAVAYFLLATTLFLSLAILRLDRERNG